MISAMVFLLAWVSCHFPRARRHKVNPRDPWEVFHQGRGLDARRDTLGAFHCYLHAAQGGLPVAASLVWMTYRVGGGVPADPIAARAWARQATAMGWPEGVLERVDIVGGHRQEPAGWP